MGRKQLLAMMVGASTVNYIGRMTMSVAGPSIAREHGFNEAQLGEIFSAFWLGYGLMMWPSGWLADRFGAARVLGLCGLATAALVAGTPIAGTLALFLVFRFLFGVASAVLYPACGNLTAIYYDARHHAGIQGLVVGGSNFGSAIAPLLAAFMMQQGGWPLSFHVVGALTLAFFGFWMVSVKDSASTAGRRPDGKMRWNAAIVLLALQAFCVGYYYSFADTWSYYYFKEVRHFDDSTSALFTTAVQISGGIMMPLGGWLSDVIAPRMGRRIPAFVALTAGGVFLAAAALAENPAAVITLLSISYSLVVACEGVFWWAVIAHAAEAPGSACGFANGVGSLAQFLAPLSFPAIAAAVNWNASVLSAAAILAIAGILWFLVPRPANQG